jgi:predicted DNA-binding protein
MDEIKYKSLHRNQNACKPGRERRTRTLHIRLSEQEYQNLAVAAKNEGESISSYIRDKITPAEENPDNSEIPLLKAEEITEPADQAQSLLNTIFSN